MRLACPAIFCSHAAVQHPDTAGRAVATLSSTARDRRYREADAFRRLTQTPLQSSASAAAAEDSTKQAASDLPAELAARRAHRTLGQ